MGERARIPRGSTLLVDGYNVLFSGRGLAAGLERVHANLPTARWILVQLLTEFQALRQGPAWLVFDSRGAPQPDRRVEAARLWVTFAPPTSTADDEIVRLVRQLGLGKELMVITSDLELRARVKAEKAQTLSSRTFLRLVLEAAGRQEQAPESDMTTDEWMRYFGCDPPTGAGQ
jgi:predicted RNA-binding protein with PIN domain